MKERIYHFKKDFTPLVDTIDGKEAILLSRDEDGYRQFGTKGMVFIGRVGETNDKKGNRYFNAPVISL